MWQATPLNTWLSGSRGGKQDSRYKRTIICFVKRNNHRKPHKSHQETKIKDLKYLQRDKMMPKTDKDDKILEEARGLQGVCWGEEYERMISGMLYVISHFQRWLFTNTSPCRYSPLAPELIEGRSRARQLTGDFNASLYGDVTAEKTVSQREEILKKLFGRTGQSIYIEPPLFVDYGCNISVGESFYANFQSVHFASFMKTIDLPLSL